MRAARTSRATTRKDKAARAQQHHAEPHRDRETEARAGQQNQRPRRRERAGPCCQYLEEKNFFIALIFWGFAQVIED